MKLSLLKYQTDHPDPPTIAPWVVAGCWDGSLDDFEKMIASDRRQMTPGRKTHLYRPAIQAQIKVLRLLVDEWSLTS